MGLRKHFQWHHAVSEEFNACLESDTWQLAPCTPIMKVIGCEWIYKTKFESNVSIEH